MYGTNTESFVIAVNNLQNILDIALPNLKTTCFNSFIKN